jgi:hypothetical protein
MVSTASKISVAEKGNKKAETSAEDVRQALNDITQYFITNAPTFYDSNLKENKGNSEQLVNATLQKFNAASSHIAISLEKYDGGLHYMDTYVGFKLAELTAVEVKGENYLAFAKDIDGNLLCIRVNGQETVVVYDFEDCSIDEDHKLNYG